MRPSYSVVWPLVGRSGERQHVLDLLFGRAVEHRRRHRHAVPQVARQRDDLVVGQRRDVRLLAARLVVDLVEEVAQLSRCAALCCIEHAADLQADALGGPAEMRLEDLADVHARRHAQRIEHDVDRRTVLEVRHVFDRNDRRHDALVAVAAGHLVARLHAALHREIHLHHLEHARSEIVARGDLGALLLEALLELLALRLQALGRTLDGGVAVLVLQADFQPLLARQVRRDTPRRSACRP